MPKTPEHGPKPPTPVSSADIEAAFKKYYSSLVRQVGRYGGQAEDAVSEAFAKLVANPPRRISGSTLRTVAQHRLIDNLRHEKTKRRGGDRLFTQSDLSDGQWENAGGDGNPELAFIRAESIQTLSRLISNLEEKPRIAFELLCLGYSHQEIAELLGISIPALKTLVCRSRKHLREKLKESDPT